MSGSPPPPDSDVVVAGGGNAALSSAIVAREAGARVLLLERDSKAWRGGNSKYTRNIRCLDASTYPAEQFLLDLVGVSGNELNRDLAALMIDHSAELPRWMETQGISWQKPLKGSLQLNHSNRFFLGGGKAMLNTYYRRAEELGVEIRYQTAVTGVELSGGRLRSVSVQLDGAAHQVVAGSLIVASGGYEANLQWLERPWGDAAKRFVIRGTSLNDGLLVDALLRQGAQPCGRPDRLHCVAVDARSPAFDGGIVTRIDAIPLGIVVNRRAERFADEGQDLWPKRYATWGRLIAQQEGQSAVALFDSKAAGKFIPSVFPPVMAPTLDELARQLELNPAPLAATVKSFNRGASGHDAYDLSRLDGNSTTGLQPPKSNWAIPIDSPPYYAYPLCPGVTFTYSGLAIDERARVLNMDGRPLEGVYAAGEAMAGNILTDGYLAGIGLTIGTSFGRIAGREAATHACAA